MNTINKKFLVVEKEEVANFLFPKEEVLTDLTARTERTENIKKGMSLGNLQKNKVEIYFEDNEALKKVMTTIWSLTENNLILKSNVLIPVHRIHKIIF